jgi:hypothetical protein
MKKLLFTLFMVFGASCMEDEKREFNIPYQWHEIFGPDMLDNIFEYLEKLDFFEKEVAIIRLKTWLAKQEYNPPQMVQFPAVQSIRFDN